MNQDQNSSQINDEITNLGGIPSTIFMSPEIDQLSSALSKAQMNMGKAKKSSENPFFKSKYADLSSCIEAIRVPLAENKLSIMQFPVNSENKIGVRTILAHDSGQWITSQLFLKPMKDDPQAVGSVITYARRYCLASILGLAQEDDDSESQYKRTNTKNTEEDKAERSSTLSKINDLIEATQTEEQKVLENYKVDKLNDLTLKQIRQLHRILDHKKEKGLKDARGQV